MRAWAMGVVVAAVAVGGCASISTTSNLVPNTDVSRFRTYAFFTPPYRQGQPESVGGQEIMAAIRRDLAAKGLTETTSGNPDFLVAYHLKEREKTEVTS